MLSVLAFCAMACRSEKTPEQAPPASAAVSAPFDVGAVMRQVHFAYRPEGQGWSGGHSTYAVRASAEGLTLTTAKPTGSARAREEATLVLGRALLTSGERALGGSISEGRLEKDGHLALEREDGIVEHLRNTDEGVEQSWAFPRAPEGEGDLRVRIPVEGLSFMGATASGLHFADARTGLGFLYGQATWVDATGRRTELKTSHEAGHLLLSVPRALVEASTYPASLSPVISPEIGLDEPVVTPAPGDQMRPVVASNRADFIVVWQDHRLGDGVSRIYGTRVTSGGILMDPWGLKLGNASGMGRQESPSVACIWKGCLVVWTDIAENQDANILGARVSNAGEVDAMPLAISTAEGDQTSPAVAANQGDWFVVWEDTRGAGSMDIRGARVMQDGWVADPEGIAIGTGAAAQRQPAVTFDGWNWLTVWRDEGSDAAGDILGARVSMEGEVLNSPALVIAAGAGSQRAPRVSSFPGRSLVVWEDSRQGGDTDIRGVRLARDGVVLDESGLVISSAPGNQYAPAVIANFEGFMVVWEDPGSGEWSIQRTHVTFEGRVGEPSIVASSTVGPLASSAVACASSTFLVVWSHQRMGDSETDIQGALMEGLEASVSKRMELSLAEGSESAADEGNAKVASNGTDYLLVWSAHRGTTGRILAARVSSMGEVLDPSGITVSFEGSSHYSPVVASDGVDWLVVWTDSRRGEIYGARVSSTGEVLDPLSLALSNTSAVSLYPSVASNGNGYLVVWITRGSDGEFDFLGARVTSQGQVQEASSLRMTSPLCSRWEPQVASNGTDYLVVWKAQGICGARVSGEGVFLDASEFIINDEPGSKSSPVLASNGEDWLVVWQHDGSRRELRGARVTSTGQVLDTSSFVIGSRPRVQFLPAVAFDGLDYLVVWNEYSGDWTDVYGARVSATGHVLDSMGLPLFTEAYGESQPSIASAGSSGYLVTYSHLEHGRSLRPRARLVSFAQPVSATSR